MPNSSLYFFEQTDFSVRFARCTISVRSLRIEEMKEILISDSGALSKLAPAGSEVVCAMRPKPRHLRLASAEEAKRHAGLAGIQQFAQLQPYDKMEQAWFAGVQANDGGPAADTPWLVSLCSEAAHRHACSTFESIKLKPAKCLDATLASAGAIVSAATNPVVLLEIGELGSQALLISQDGVLAVQPVALNLAQIADAIQAELNLNSRAAAAAIFLDPGFDFTKAGSKIAARLAPALGADLARLAARHPAPGILFCTGLPGSQQWLAAALAATGGLTSYNPNIKAWSAGAGLTFATPNLGASVSPDWFGFLHFINSQTLESPKAIAWQAEWHSLKIPVPRPAPRNATASPFSDRSSPLKPHTTPPMPVPALASVGASSKSATRPVHSVAPWPVSPSAQAKTVVLWEKPGTQPPMPHAEERPRQRKLPQIVGAVILLGILLVAGYFYHDSQNEETTRLSLERNKAAEQLRQEKEKSRLAEQKAKEEAQARKQSEQEAAQKLAESEGARVQAETARRLAEAEASRQADAAHRATVRGAIVVTTIPAGANVSVGSLPPRSSPATFSDLPIGKYPVIISLSRHEDVKLELEVTENGTTESGTINLVSFSGNLELTSDPAGAEYELYPVNTAIVSMDAQRTGKTPALVEELEPGDYSVTFTRSGWITHTETVSVVRNATARLAWTFPTGTVKITSSPAGAAVTSEGTKLGVTPLTLAQPTGSARYELSLVGYDPVELSGSIAGNRTLELAAQLHESDRTFGPGELDQPPEALSQKAPKLPDHLTLVDGRVVMELTINRDGSPTNIKVVRASNPELGKIYQAAAAKWKFKPGLAGGKPVRSTVILPILISAVKF